MAKVDQDKLTGRRNEILTAAEKVFGTRGYAEATIEQVAGEAGISKGSVYNYFQSKQDLFARVFQRGMAAGEAQTDELIRRPMGARAKLEQLLDMWFERFSHYQTMGRLFLEFWVTAAGENQQGPFTTAIQDLYNRYLQRVTEIIQQGIDAGEFVAQYGPRTAAALIMAIVDGIGLEAQLGLVKDPSGEYLAALKRGIFNALSAKLERPRPDNHIT